MIAESHFLEQQTSAVPSAAFAGVTVNPLTREQLTALVSSAVAHRGKAVIAHHNLHSFYLFHRDSQLRDFYAKASWTHIDGMPLVAIARLHGYRMQRNQRVTYVDWIESLMPAAANSGWRVFYLGSAPGVADKGSEILRKRFPGMEIRVHDGYFDAAPDSSANREVLAEISAFNPDILMVGMGMPRQEKWILENLEYISAHVILPCGAAMDYIADTIPTPPRWAGRLGLEWLFRLAAEPRRLAYRYLVEPWSVLGIVVASAFRHFFRSPQPRAAAKD